MKFFRFFFFLSALLAEGAAAIEFIGYSSVGNGLKFGLVDDAQDRRAWVAVGQEFAGFKITAFSREEKSITLQNTVETRVLPLRGAAFSISPAVVGVEREQEFFKKLKSMAPSSGRGKRFYTVDEYIATAAQFGRVITSFEITDGQEVIVMDLPDGARAAPSKDGLVHKHTFTTSQVERDKVRRKLTIH